MHKKSIIIAVLLVCVVASAAIIAYRLVIYERRDEIAEAILFDEDGYPLDDVLDSALQTRFPIGTPVEGVVSFAEAQGGKCFGSDTLICRYVYEATTCVAHSVEIGVAPERGQIQQIRARFRGDYC